MEKWLVIITVLIIAFVAFKWATKSNNEGWLLGGKYYSFTKLNEQVFVMQGPMGPPSEHNKGFINNPAIVKTKNGMVIIDPGSTKFIGEQIISQSKRVSDQPILAAFNTHLHGDHWLANIALIKAYPNMKIYGHPVMIERIAEGDGKVWLARIEAMTRGQSKGTEVHGPDNAVNHLDEITIDGEVFRIHTPVNIAHTNTDIMIEHPNSKTLFLGDNGFNERLGRFRVDTSSIFNVIKVLEYALKLDINTFVPGHGPAGKANDTVLPYLEYLRILTKTVKQGYDNDLEDYEIRPQLLKRLKKYESWHRFDTFLGNNLSKAYLEIEEQE